MAAFKRDLGRKNIHFGRPDARACGRKGGGPRKLAYPTKVDLARRLSADGQTDISTNYKTLGNSRATLHRYLDRPGNDF